MASKLSHVSLFCLVMGAVGVFLILYVSAFVGVGLVFGAVFGGLGEWYNRLKAKKQGKNDEFKS